MRILVHSPALEYLLMHLPWWCSRSASDSWSKGRWFDSRSARYQVN